jgi:hypothetical protein
LDKPATERVEEAKTVKKQGLDGLPAQREVLFLVDTSGICGRACPPKRKLMPIRQFFVLKEGPGSRINSIAELLCPTAQPI